MLYSIRVIVCVRITNNDHLAYDEFELANKYKNIDTTFYVEATSGPCNS